MPSVTAFFKHSTVPNAAKQQITDKCVEFVCRDIRPFKVVCGTGFLALADALILVGVKYGQIAAKDILPHPTTISRNIAARAAALKDEIVIPHIKSFINTFGGAVTTDMWTEQYSCISYISLTIHYIDNEWSLVVRTLSTSEFDPELRHTGINIRDTIGNIMAEFEVDASKVIFVTDRGANMLAALKNDCHLPCCDHMLNTALSHVFDNKNLDNIPDVRSLVTGSKELVRYFKKGGNMALLSKSLKQEVPTRWNSNYTMLHSILESYDEVEHILETKGQRFRYSMILVSLNFLINIVSYKAVNSYYYISCHNNN